MPLEDDHGWAVTGIRVSLTDRCNFDCVYRHNEGLGDTRGPMAPQDDEMTADEVIRVLEVVREFGVESVKLTGGEPIVLDDTESATIFADLAASTMDSVGEIRRESHRLTADAPNAPPAP